MHYLRGWRALRADPEWKGKVGVGTVLLFSSLFVPVLGQLALSGWLVLALRRAVQGGDAPLPPLRLEVEYLKNLLGLGIKPFIAQLLYSLPMVAMAMLMGCFGSFTNIAVQNDAPPALLFGLLAILFALYFVAILVTVPWVLVASLRASLVDDLKEAVSFRAVRGMARLLLKDILVGAFVMTLISMPIAFAGMLCCYVGIFPAAIVLSVLQTYFHAELYRVYLEKGGAPLAIGPMDVAAS